MGRVIRNAAKCLACGVTIESKHRHDYVLCGCPNETMVDGGLSYLRRGAVDWGQVEDLSIEEHDGPTIEGERDKWTDSSMMEESNA